MLIYVDEMFFIIQKDEHAFHNNMGNYLYVKGGSIGSPMIYKENKVSNVTLENGVDAWSFSSSQYVQDAVENIEQYLKEYGQYLHVKKY